MEQASTGSRRYWLGGKRKAEQDRFFKAALDTSLWQAGDAGNWNACWYTGMPPASAFRKAGPDHTINHIPGNNALTIKSRLYDTVSAMRDRVTEQYGAQHELISRLSFLPRVYAMPRDYHQLQQAALDDPDRRWILKPKNAARGKGVRVIRDVASAPLGESWMVQEYLERPHTMHQRKYVLRLYVLIASIEPLRVYLYQQGFAKLASAPYDINSDNRYSHLTNPDINALNTDAEVPVEFVDLDHYRHWLREQGHDDGTLFARIHDLVALTAIAAVEPMRTRTAESGADPRGCYELLGIDCLVDQDLTPWILECNLSPSLGVYAGPDSGGPVEERIKGKLMADMVSLLGLNLPANETSATDPVERIRVEAEEELARAGDFQRLYPNREVESYLPYFALPRLADMILADAVKGSPVRRPTLQCRHAAEIITEHHLSLYDEHTGRYHRLNETASFIWLKAMEGADPDAIAEALASAVSAGSEQPDLWTIRNDVWNGLADWARDGLIMQRGPEPVTEERLARRSAGVEGVRKTGGSAPALKVRLGCGALDLELIVNSQPPAVRLESLLWPLQTRIDTPVSSQLEVVRDTPGYTFVLDGEVVETRLPLAAVGPRLAAQLVKRAAAENEVVMDVALVVGPGRDTGAVIFAGGGEGDALALHYAGHWGREFSRGVRLAVHSAGRVTPLALPLQLVLSQFSSMGPAAADPTHVGTAYRHILSGGVEGSLIPATETALSDTPEVAAVVFPRSGDDASETVPRAVSVDEALGWLLPVCGGAGGKPLDADTLAALADWLSRRPLYAVGTSDLEAAAQALAVVQSPRYEQELTSAN